MIHWVSFPFTTISTTHVLLTFFNALVAKQNSQLSYMYLKSEISTISLIVLSILSRKNISRNVRKELTHQHHHAQEGNLHHQAITYRFQPHPSIHFPGPSPDFIPSLPGIRANLPSNIDERTQPIRQENGKPVAKGFLLNRMSHRLHEL